MLAKALTLLDVVADLVFAGIKKFLVYVIVAALVLTSFLVTVTLLGYSIVR